MHTLSEALDLSPSDPVILNELGVVYISINRYHITSQLKLLLFTCNNPSNCLNRADDALPILQKAAQYILMNNQSRIGNTGCLEVWMDFLCSACSDWI